MKKEDFEAKIQAIGICEDDAQRRTLLAELNSEAGADYDSFATANTTAETLRSENEELRNANLKLFLMVGNDDDGGQDDNGQEKNKPESKKREWADLFDDKGNLK